MSKPKLTAATYYQDSSHHTHRLTHLEPSFNPKKTKSDMNEQQARNTDQQH